MLTDRSSFGKSTATRAIVAASFSCPPALMPVMGDFTALYELHHAAILRYCAWKSHDRDIGEDLVQDTFLRFWLCLERGEQVSNVRALLYRIAHNLFVDHVRRKKETSLDVLLEAGFEPSVDPWHVTVSALDARRPLEQLQTMQRPYRTVLHRRFMQGLLPADIATLTGESTNAVSVRIFRGLRQLRGMLKESPVG